MDQHPKISRNDPCPCGSGKKYKKCCGGPSPTTLAGASITQQLDSIIKNHADVIIKSMENTIHTITSRCFKDPRWKKFSSDIERIELAYAVIFEEAKQILEKTNRSRHYLYPLIRRTVYLFIRFFNKIPGLSYSFESEGSIEIDLLAITSNFVITQIYHSSPSEWVDETDISGIKYEITTEEITALAKITILAEIKRDLEVRYRFIGKGVPAFSGEKKWNQSQRLRVEGIQLYEKRRGKYQTVTGSAGIWCDPVETTPKIPQLCKTCTAFSINKPIQIISKNPNKVIDGRWIMHSIVLSVKSSFFLQKNLNGYRT